MTVNELLHTIRSMLCQNNVDNFENEAYFITEKALSLSKTQMLLKFADEVTYEQSKIALSAAEKRISGIPVQYCIGEWDFYGETYKVGEGVLIPRPETEELCEIVINELKHKVNSTIIDLCSGSGCIGITVGNNVPDSTVFLVEKSEDALKYLKQNTKNLCEIGQVYVVHGDVLNPDSFDKVFSKVDVIVSNPPYIKSEEIATLQKEVQQEPRMALDGGADGYDFYRVICAEWHRYLKEDGLIAFECGENQAEYICTLFNEDLFETQIIKDFNGIDRFVLGRMKTR